MGRGYPAVLSFILSIPFFAFGGLLVLGPFDGGLIPGVTVPQSDLHLIGLSILVFSLFILAGGFYFQYISRPSAPQLREDEEIVDNRHPSQRVAITKATVGIPLLIITGYLLFFTTIPYVYPTLTLIFGLFFFSSGLKTYWANTLTAYYVTTRRVIKEYRFLALRRQEIPLDKVRGVEERKSVSEAIVGLGNIRVVSGGGGGSVRISMRNISESTEVAEMLRKLMD